MAQLDDRLSQYSRLAIETAARELEIDPLEFARRLNQAEIARLVHLLNAALRHVEHAQLRHRIEDLLMSLTEGRMPGEEAESELDWALKVTRRRREDAARRDRDPEEPDEPGDPDGADA